MTEFESVRMELTNHIDGLEIAKSAIPELWTLDDEHTLRLMHRIRDILERIKEADT